MTVDTFSELVSEHREALERLADGDFALSPYASALLDAYDAGDLGEP